VRTVFCANANAEVRANKAARRSDRVFIEEG
jgi:hypothetical protein